MSLFGCDPPLEEKPASVHPWAKRIKYVYANEIKYAHNSVYNPKYPKEEDLKKVKKEPKGTELSENLVKFQIIGVRVSEEFIYCSRLVEGLHKYRCRKFAPPILRAVTTVEWPKVLNDIKLQYRGIAFCLKTSCIVLMNGDLLGGIDELKEFILSKYSYNLCLDLYKESIKEFVKFVNSTTRSFVYMHFEVNAIHIGTMIFMLKLPLSVTPDSMEDDDFVEPLVFLTSFSQKVLYTDIAPNTCENFMRLCTQSRGGYRGTPVHRIVKDCWIQCGGYGLKDSGMHCENFIVPFDRRGVLGMANAERHIDCSTQFFIILQPAPWMSQRYVAFGQLVDGNDTLEEIEKCPVYYESPTQEIRIYASGVLNLECHDIMINKHAKEYIYAHIENVCEVGENFWKELWENVAEKIDEIEDTSVEDDSKAAVVSEIKRIIRKTSKKAQTSTDSGLEGHSALFDENNDFDVESYRYEPEEYSYQHATSYITTEKGVKPEKIYYMPFTDVPYPGECDSTFDLKKFLKGDYCLGSDLQEDAPRKVIKKYPPEIIAEVILEHDDGEEHKGDESDEDLDSEDEKEIRNFFKENAETISFAGPNIKKIAKAEVNMFEGIQRLGLMSRKAVAKFKISTVVADDELRKNRVLLADRGITLKERHISLSVPTDHIDKRIKRRQTGFAKNIDIGNILSSMGDDDDDDDEDDEKIDEDEPYLTKKIRAKEAAAKSKKPVAEDSKHKRDSTGRASNDFDENWTQTSTLRRLYDEVKINEKEPPTLKSYRPILETHSKHLLLTNSRTFFDKELGLKDDKIMELRNSKESFEIMTPHSFTPKKLETKISSDYFNTLENHHHHQTSKGENSIRSAEYAKTRPALSIMEYQTKIRKAREAALGNNVYVVEIEHPRII